jgi:hypothetical protein
VALQQRGSSRPDNESIRAGLGRPLLNPGQKRSRDVASPYCCLNEPARVPTPGCERLSEHITPCGRSRSASPSTTRGQRRRPRWPATCGSPCRCDSPTPDRDDRCSSITGVSTVLTVAPASHSEAALVAIRLSARRADPPDAVGCRDGGASGRQWGFRGGAGAVQLRAPARGLLGGALSAEAGITSSSVCPPGRARRGRSGPGPVRWGARPAR